MKSLLKDMQHRQLQYQTRRHFLKTSSMGIGAMALSSLLGNGTARAKGSNPVTNPMGIKDPHFPAQAKSVIYMHMAGSPSQLELFDYKPDLYALDGKACPPSLIEGKDFAFIQGTPTMLAPQHKFGQYGDSGAWVTDRLPHFQTVVDDVAFLKAMHTDEFNHAPAQLLLQTGSPRLGRPSMGSWVTYGLGTENSNLPGFVVLISGGKTPSAGKSAWGSGFLPSVYQGVQCRSEGDPVLYISDPDGINRNIRRKTIDAINQLNQKQYEEFQDPEILTRIAQYEMAFNMQISVPEVMDISKEPAYIKEMYGAEPGKASLANNCLLARRLVEHGVRFVQLYDFGWDSHGNAEFESLQHGFVNKCRNADRPITALVKDLKQRGLLDQTIIVWGGEFGRTPMSENRGGRPARFPGRDHNNEAFTMWMAGGGIKGGISHGRTDDLGYAGVEGRTHPNDLQATILRQLGFDHEQFTHQYQGRPFRLTDVGGKVIKEILS